MPSNSTATNVDENGYLKPQPSVAYVASHQVNSSSSSSPTTTTTVAEPASLGYRCVMTPASVQRHQTQDDPTYQPLQPLNDIRNAQLYQCLWKEMML